MHIHTSTGQLILVIDKYFRLYFKKSLKEYGLTSAAGLVLLVVYGGREKTQDEVIAELHYDKGVMARTMRLLDRKGYLIRRDNPNDNRSYIYETTTKADEFIPVIIGYLKEWDKILTKEISEEEMKITYKVLSKMVKNVSENKL